MEATVVDKLELPNKALFDSTGIYKPVADALATFVNALATNLVDSTKQTDSEGRKKAFLRADALLKICDAIGGGGIIAPVPTTLVETAKISNRIVSFILDGTHFGTGILVGKYHVLTAAHLFFDEDGQLIDPRRAAGITVEAHTTYLGNILMEGPRRPAKLANAATLDGWLVDPKINTEEATDVYGQRQVRYVATREVADLDFAIVKLGSSFEEDIGFGVPRGYVEIPTADEAEVLSTNLGVRVFQFLDRKDLLTSSGHVHDITARGYRVRHTASTADSASGAFIGNDEFKFVAMHLGGSASGELPRFNRALPIRRIAEEIDRVRPDGTTVRAALTG